MCKHADVQDSLTTSRIFPAIRISSTTSYIINVIICFRWDASAHHCCSGFLHNTWNLVRNASGSYGRAGRRLGRRCRIHHLRNLHHPYRHLTAIVWWKRQNQRVVSVIRCYLHTYRISGTSAVTHRFDFYAWDLPARCPRVICVPCQMERCADSDWQCRSLCCPKHRASFWWRWSSSGLSPRKRPQGIQTAWDTQPRSDALTESAWLSC